jgi:hypothetical protein
MEIVKDKEEECICGNSLPIPQGHLKVIMDNILANSWIPQPDLALSASLAVMSTVIGRKFIFGGLAPNLYLGNISPSGSGKDGPQQQIKKYLSNIGADHLLGSGDYVSDAALMDGLALKPSRCDLFDELGGILKTVTQGRSEYNGKMGDILCNLYTSSNSKFMGRATQQGNQGSVDRPHIVILGSTTPVGFSEGVSRTALDKGILGRFIFFFGDGKAKATRLTSFPELDKNTTKFLRELVSFNPEVNFDVSISGIEQLVHEIKADNNANKLLDQIFEEFDDMRRNSTEDNPMLPIISRLYQQMAKIAMIHSCGRLGKDAIINIDDVKFGYNLIMYYYQNMQVAVAKLVHINYNERMFSDILDFIPLLGSDGITSQSLSIKTRYLGKRKRDELLNELIETGEIVRDRQNINDRNQVVYWRTK